MQSSYLPWLTGRALGLAGYGAVTALVCAGLWLQHPWRQRARVLHPETTLRVHAALAVAAVLLVAGHMAALALDRFAGVGWRGALVPGMSGYRRLPVALGTLAFFLIVLLAVSAGLAGHRGTRHWLGIHRIAIAAFALAWAHGVLAGSDTPALRAGYVLSGGAVAALALTRYAATPPQRGRREAGTDRNGRELDGAGR